MKHSFRCALFALTVFMPAFAAADPITIDASTPPAAPTPLNFATGGKSPDGHELAVNSRYFTLDGKPFFPVMGEFHFSRYPANEWEDEILKMKAGGINVLSVYIFWLHHEETKGQFDWAGQKDLHKFVELCGKHGLYVWLRIGPWDHGEARNGGFPDWLVAEVSKRRSNDPTYLDYVGKFFNQIGAQVKGQFWKDGGPIIGVQVENEYHPGSGGLEHMETLLQLAHTAGIDAPFYTATGWDRATIPTTDFLPVFGGYTEQFWSNSLKELPPNQNFFFTHIRAEDNVMGDLSPKNPGYNNKYDGYPFLTAEMGGGMAIAYHRRPIMYADDSTAAALVKLGAGITGLGYYMYHGGTNPDGLTSLQETQSQPDRAGYNDMEAKSYDFQAPLGEFGQFHPTFFSMKVIHQFLNDFGSQLAPMVSYLPDQMPANTTDVSTPRVAARADGKSGFIFINNYQRNYLLDEHKDFQVALKLADETVTVPAKPTTIPSGSYMIWPVNLDLDGVKLKYATAELVCKIADGNMDTFIFSAWPGVEPEFMIDGKGFAGNLSLGAGTLKQMSVGGAAVALLNGLSSDKGSNKGMSVGLISSSGKSVKVVVLTRAEALNLYQMNIGGQERLLLSPAGLFTDGKELHLSSRDPKNLKVEIYPALGKVPAGFKDAGLDGIFEQYTTQVDEIKTPVALSQSKPAAPSQPAKVGRRTALEPEDADFDRAGVWSVKVPADVLAHANAKPILEVNYQGDVARIYAGSRFADDNFYKGPAWEIGLWRFTPEELAKGLDLKILPLRSDTKLFLEKSAQVTFPESGEVLNVKDVSIAWEYEAVLKP